MFVTDVKTEINVLLVKDYMIVFTHIKNTKAI